MTAYGSVQVRLVPARPQFGRLRRVVGAVLVVAGLTGLAELSTVSADAGSPVPVRSDITPPCKSDEVESPFRCVWDARHMGNGRGNSFVIRATGELVYVTHRRAHRLWETFA